MNHSRATRSSGRFFTRRGVRALPALLLPVLALGLLPGCEDNGTPTATTAKNPAPAETSDQPAPTQLASNPAPADLSTAPNSLRNTAAPAPSTTPSRDELEPGEIPVGPPPPVRFEPSTVDLGILSPGDERTGTVQIVNLSDQPLRIVASRSSCKCTAVDLANTVIPPGESVPLSASMKPDSRLGPKSAKVRVAFEGYDQVAVVDVHAEVALTVRAEPAYFNLAKSLDGVEPPFSGVVHVTSLDGQPFSILSANREEPVFVDFDPATDAPRSEYSLRWDMTPYKDSNCEGWPKWWLIETDHAAAPVIDVYVRHRCTVPKVPGSRRWLTPDHRSLVGGLKPGESKEVVVGMIWVPAARPYDFGDHVVQAVSRTTDFDVELVSTDYTLEEPELTLRITPKPDFRGVLYGDIELHSRHGHMTEHTIIGKVVE